VTLKGGKCGVKFFRQISQCSTVITVTSVSYGKNGNFDPGKIETLEQIDTQFIRIDYMHERNVYSKIGENPFTAFWAFG